MSYRAVFLLTILTVTVAFCVPSYADEDGFFCTGSGYLAYELRSGITPGVDGHVLRMVRFEPKVGIYIADQVTLQDFQVHHMECGEARIAISGWGAIFKSYVIEIASSQKLRIANFAEDPARHFDPSKDGPDPPMLGYGQPRTLPLESSDPDHKYQLVLSESAKRVEEGLETYRKAELIQLDLRGAISQRLLLYERRSVEFAD